MVSQFPVLQPLVSLGKWNRLAVALWPPRQFEVGASFLWLFSRVGVSKVQMVRRDDLWAP